MAYQLSSMRRPSQSLLRMSTKCQLQCHSPAVKVNENSPLDEIIGSFSTLDPDNYASARQTFTYALVDTAQGRFKLSSGKLQVATSNVNCLSIGGLYCKLNFEKDQTHDIVVQVTDSGSPPLSKSFKLTINVENINDQPRHLTVSNTIVKENDPADTVVGKITYTDEDIGQTHTITMTDTDGGQFKLSADGTEILKAKSTDYETKAVHSVTIKVTDNGSPPMSIIKDIQISVTDINEAPISSIFTSKNGQLTYADDHAKVNENSNVGTTVGTIVATDTDNNQQLKFTLDDSAGSRFAIASTATCDFTTGSKCSAALTVFDSLDHEESASLSIVVRVTDPQGKFKVTKFTVVIIDVNDPPSDINMTSDEVHENKVDAFVGAFLTTDDDITQTHKYTLLNSANGRFIITGDDLYTVGSLNYEVTKTLTIRVRTTDSGTPALSYEKDIVIRVINVNEKPTSMHITSDQVDENSASDTAIGSLSTQDPDNVGATPLQTFNYALLDTAGGRFKIDSGVLKVNPSNVACLALGGTSCWLNYEAQPQYSVLVRSTDSGTPPLSANFVVNITLKDINDRPRKLYITDYRVAENSLNGTVVGTFGASDEDAFQHLTYELTSDDHGMFKLVGKELQKAKPANYEITTQHRITLRVTDDGTPPLSISKTFTIEVLNENEAPVNTSITATDGQLAFAKDLPEVEENSVLGTIVGTIISIDPDYQQTLTFTLDDDASGLFSLGTNNSCGRLTDLTGHHSLCQTQLLVSGALNFESVKTHDIIVRVTDQDNRFSVQKFTIKIVDVNDLPHDIEILSRTIDENSQMVYITDFVTQDQDKTHIHTYSLASNPGNQFVIVNNSLYTAAIATLNYEKQQQWTIKVRSTDNGIPAKNIEKAFVIDVVDVNEAPTAINITGFTVLENSPNGTVIGELLVTDPDNFGPKGHWQNASCSAMDNAGGIFTIVDNIVKVVQASLDYEAVQNYTIAVRCTDDGAPTLSLSWVFSVHVLNANEIPTSTSISNDTLDENAPNGTVVGIFSTVDPDNEHATVQSFTYSIVHAMTNLPFVIVGDELIVAGSLDYEVRAAWPITVESTDSGGLSTLNVFQINVNNLNEPPTGFRLFPGSNLAEDSPVGTDVADVLAVDDDDSDLHTFEVLGVAPGILLNSSSMDPSLSDMFVINETNGVLSTGNYSFDYETTSSYTVWIRTSDLGLTPSYDFVDIIIVNISDVNEAPSDITLDNDEVDENSRVGALVGHLTVTDPDNADSLHTSSQHFSCSVLDAKSRSFKVVNLTTLVVSKDNLDFENDPTHFIEIQCWDNDKVNPLFMNKQFTITLKNVNEAPTMIMLSNTRVAERLGPHAQLGTVSAKDPDNEVTHRQNITFTLQDQNTTDVPLVLVYNHILETTMNLDFESRRLYTLTVIATDDGNPVLSSRKQFNVSVINENDPPTEVVLNSTGVAEDSPLGTDIGTLSTKDGDIGQTYTYTVLPYLNITDSSMFGIHGNTLILLRRLDYESEDSWPVLIQTEDSGFPRLTHRNVVYVNVIDVNEPPSEIDMDYQPTLEESISPGTLVANFTVMDPDVNQTHTCHITEGESSFIISSGSTASGGEAFTILISDKTTLDYEAGTTVYVKINCSDDGMPSLSISRTIAFTVEDVNEQPTGILISGNHAVPENSPPGYAVGTLSTVDPDMGQIYTYILIGDAVKTFMIIDASNELVVKNNTLLNYEENTQITVTVQTTDNGVPARSFIHSINISISDINEPPTNIRLLGSGELKEDAANGDILGRLTCDNPEKAQTLSYTIDSPTLQVSQTMFSVYTNASGAFVQLVNNTDMAGTSILAFVVNVTDNGHPPESGLQMIAVKLIKLDPCAQGTRNCGSGAYCQRVNMSSALCPCKSGFVPSSIPDSCMQRDDCIAMSGEAIILLSHGAASGSLPPAAAVSSTPVSVCENNATCMDLTNDYVCSCTPGFTGQNCEIRFDRCTLQPGLCQHNGTCVDSSPNTGLSCVCPIGYNGSHCDVNPDDCPGAVCGVGTCVDGLAMFTCTCPPSRTGRICQYASGACDSALCTGSDQCIPRSLDDTSLITVSSSEKTQYMCVPPSFIVNDRFHTDSALTDTDREKWEDTVRGIKIMDADGKYISPDDIIILPAATDDEISYVVLLDDAPVDPYTVKHAMNTTCHPHEHALAQRLARLCTDLVQDAVEPQSQAASQASEQSDHPYLVWGIVSGLLLAALLILILVTIKVQHTKKLLGQSKQRERRLQAPVDDSDALAAEFMFDGYTDYVYSGGDRHFSRNPLYYDPALAVNGEDPDGQGSTMVTSSVYDAFQPSKGDMNDQGSQASIYATLEHVGGEEGVNELYSELQNSASSPFPGGAIGMTNPVYEGFRDEPEYTTAAEDYSALSFDDGRKMPAAVVDTSTATTTTGTARGVSAANVDTGADYSALEFGGTTPTNQTAANSTAGTNNDYSTIREAKSSAAGAARSSSYSTLDFGKRPSHTSKSRAFSTTRPADPFNETGESSLQTTQQRRDRKAAQPPTNLGDSKKQVQIANLIDSIDWPEMS
eukprot:scpid22649/ scgid18623/ Cadherin-related tumor suppressor; Protein fat